MAEKKQEPKEKKPRGMCIVLPKDLEELVRQVAAGTDMNQTELQKRIAAHPKIEEAAREVCSKAVDAHVHEVYRRTGFMKDQQELKQEG